MLPELRSAIIAECRRKVAEGGEALAIEFLIVEMADEAAAQGQTPASVSAQNLNFPRAATP